MFKTFPYKLNPGRAKHEAQNLQREQIITILKECEAGLSVEQVVRKHGIALSTFHRWKSKYSGREVSDAKRLREL